MRRLTSTYALDTRVGLHIWTPGLLRQHSSVIVDAWHLAAGTCQTARLAVHPAAAAGWAALRQELWQLVLTAWLPTVVVIHAGRWAATFEKGLHRLLPAHLGMKVSLEQCRNWV